MQSIRLKVELFAGAEIFVAASDLCELANRVGTLCEAKFNGVRLWARPGDDPAKLVVAWRDQIKRSPDVYKIAQVQDTQEGAAQYPGPYSQEDRDFFDFWYGHMIGDLMQPPLASVDHSTARYIWDAARRMTPALPTKDR